MSTPAKLVLLALLLFSTVLFAQETPPPPEPPGENLPINGIVWLGSLVAITYGVIKKRNK